MAMHNKEQDHTIILVGLMGAGKSTIGKKLAKMLHMEFRDSDDDITYAAGCSIADIFSVHGEPIFRDLEERVINRLLTEDSPKVLATGGGAWMNPNIRAIARKTATSVWLKADVDVLVERVSRKNTRPLLEQGDKKAILSKMTQERYPFYEQADIIIDSDIGSHDDVVQHILEALERYRTLHDAPKRSQL